MYYSGILIANSILESIREPVQIKMIFARRIFSLPANGDQQKQIPNQVLLRAIASWASGIKSWCITINSSLSLSCLTVSGIFKIIVKLSWVALYLIFKWRHRFGRSYVMTSRSSSIFPDLYFYPRKFEMLTCFFIFYFPWYVLLP